MLCFTPSTHPPLPAGVSPQLADASALPSTVQLATWGPDWAAQEFSGAQLPDPRQVRSLQRIAAALAAHPNRSLTAACGAPPAPSRTPGFRAPADDPGLHLGGALREPFHHCPE